MKSIIFFFVVFLFLLNLIADRFNFVCLLLMGYGPMDVGLHETYVPTLLCLDIYRGAKQFSLELTVLNSQVNSFIYYYILLLLLFIMYCDSTWYG